MSTKKQHQEKRYNSLIHQLEDTILSLEAAGQSEMDIYSLVNMILKGFIRNGNITEEYIQLANQAIAMRKQREDADISPLYGLGGERLN